MIELQKSIPKYVKIIFIMICVFIIITNFILEGILRIQF